jgi:hypothetical protein
MCNGIEGGIRRPEHEQSIKASGPALWKECLEKANMADLNASAILAESGTMTGAVKCLLNGVPLHKAALQELSLVRI